MDSMFIINGILSLMLIMLFVLLYLVCSFMMSGVIFTTPLKKHHRKVFFKKYFLMSFLVVASVILPLWAVPVLAQTNFVGLLMVFVAYALHVCLTGRLLKGPKILCNEKKQDLFDAFDM